MNKFPTYSEVIKTVSNHIVGMYLLSAYDEYSKSNIKEKFSKVIGLLIEENHIVKVTFYNTCIVFEVSILIEGKYLTVNNIFEFKW